MRTLNIIIIIVISLVIFFMVIDEVQKILYNVKLQNPNKTEQTYFSCIKKYCVHNNITGSNFTINECEEYNKTTEYILCEGECPCLS